MTTGAIDPLTPEKLHNFVNLVAHAATRLKCLPAPEVEDERKNARLFVSFANGAISVEFASSDGAIPPLDPWMIDGCFNKAPDEIRSALAQAVVSRTVGPHGGTLYQFPTAPGRDKATFEALEAALLSLSLQGINVHLNETFLPPMFPDWRDGQISASGRNASYLIVNGFFVGAVPVATEDEGVFFWKKVSVTDYPAPTDQAIAELACLRPKRTVMGTGPVSPSHDPLSDKPSLARWGISDISEITPSLIESIGPDAAAAMMRSLSERPAYAMPDIHYQPTVIGWGADDARLPAFVDEWAAAVRSVSRAAGWDSVRVGLCQGQSSWDTHTDGVPILYVDPEQYWSTGIRGLQAQAIFALTGYNQDHPEHAGGEDRATAMVRLFSSVRETDEDAYLGLRKSLRAAMGSDAEVFVKDGQEPSMAAELCEWAAPELEPALGMDAASGIHTLTLNGGQENAHDDLLLPDLAPEPVIDDGDAGFLEPVIPLSGHGGDIGAGMIEGMDSVFSMDVEALLDGGDAGYDPMLPSMPATFDGVFEEPVFEAPVEPVVLEDTVFKEPVVFEEPVLSTESSFPAEALIGHGDLFSHVAGEIAAMPERSAQPSPMAAPHRHSRFSP